MKLNAYINDAVLQASDKASQNLMQRIQEVVMNARRQQMEDQQKEKAPQQ